MTHTNAASILEKPLTAYVNGRSVVESAQLDTETEETMPQRNVNNKNQEPGNVLFADWLWKLVGVIFTAFVAYMQMQTTLAISQLELKIERQRADDFIHRPGHKDIERIEQQIQELKNSLDKGKK